MLRSTLVLHLSQNSEQPSAAQMALIRFNARLEMAARAFCGQGIRKLASGGVVRDWQLQRG